MEIHGIVPEFSRSQVSNVGLNSCGHHLFQENHLKGVAASMEAPNFQDENAFHFRNLETEEIRGLPTGTYLDHAIIASVFAKKGMEIMKSSANSDMNYGSFLQEMTFDCI